MQYQDHIIGCYEGNYPGPLFVCIGGMHGNEPAGVKAIELLIKMLEVEPITNPSFKFYGNFIGLLGNPKAYSKNERFIDHDMNRQWTPENLQNPQTEEQRAINRVLEIIKSNIEKYQASEVYFLDLHTTSSTGGIFSIIGDDPASLKIAQAIYAPIIKGFIHVLQGTSLHYLNESYFDIPTTSLVFEAGNHEDPISVNRAIAAIICYMRSVGNVVAGDVENQHVEILKEYSKKLPGLTELLYRHVIDEKDGFIMNANYQNFQKIKKGEILAHDIRGNVKAPYTGMILLPLYQKLGSDGFFIVKSIEK